MKKVLIVNRGCCDNLGDQAINIAMKKFLISNYNVITSFSDYTSLSDEPKNIDLNVSNITLKMKLRELLKKFIPLKLIWLIRNYSRLNRKIKDNVDYIIIGGGQLILSNSTFDIAAATWVYLAKSYNIPIIFCSVGAGTNFNFINKVFFSYALRNAKSICVRDEASRATIRSEFNIDSYVSGDIVFTESIILDHIDNLTLLGIPSLSVYNTYNTPISHEEYYSNWLAFLKKNNVDINDCSLFYTTSDDYIESVGFKAYLHEKNICHIDILFAEGFVGLELLMRKASTVISGRMHGLIVALNFNCDILVYPISGKLIVFKKTVEDSTFDLNKFKLNVIKRTEVFLDKLLVK